MSDIKKGYTFTDKSTDWASNKETAIRLNKMMDEAKLNLVAGTNIIITPTINGPSIAATGGGTGTVTSVAATGGTGISVTGSPITTSGTLNIVNTAPDQTVVLTGAGTTAITGTYPSFTVTSNDAYVGTVTSVGGTGTVSGVTLTGTVTGSGNLTLGGTLAVTPSNFASQTANTVLIAPNGSVGTPTFRALVAADVPILNQNTTGSSGSCTGNAATASNVAYSGLTGTVPTWNQNTTGNAATASSVPYSGLTGTVPTWNQNTTGTAANVTGTVAVANGGTGTASPSLVAGTNVTISGSWPNQTVNSTAGGGGGGTVTSVSVVSSNGLAGTVANATTTPAITLSTTVTGLVKGNGTTLSAATAGSDYQAPITLTTTGTSGAATFVSNTLNIPQYSGGGGSGTVTSVSVVAANGVSGSVATSTTTPAITLTLGDISAATSKPSSGTARSFTSRNGDIVNVKDYGATGDGSTDDTTAIAAAFAVACSTTKSGTLYFPSGTYINNNTLTGSFGVHDQIYGLTIMGDGIGTTIIKQTVNPTSGTYKGVFNITNLSCLGCLTVKDLSFWNISGMSTDACIKYSVSEIREDDAHANLRVDNVFIGANFGSNTWTIGLDLYRVHNGNICNYQYCGDNNRGGTGIVFQKYGSGTFTAGSFVVNQRYVIDTVGTTDFTLIGASANTVGVFFTATGAGSGSGTATVVPAGANKSMACFIQGCQFNLCNIGVRLKDSMETCLIQESLMVGLVYGVYADYCIHLGVSNSHINVNPSVGAGVACIYSSGGTFIAGSFVVGQSYVIATVGTTDFTLIGAASNTVGLSFTATGVGTGNGTATISGATGDVDQSVIMGNLLYCQGGTNLIGISGGFVRSSISGNSFIALGGQAGTRGLSVTGKGLSITGNSFYQHTDTYITSSADYSIISSNTATKVPGPVATTPYSISGTGTTSANNIYEP
jgi:hypothetical protein